MRYRSRWGRPAALSTTFSVYSEAVRSSPTNFQRSTTEYKAGSNRIRHQFGASVGILELSQTVIPARLTGVSSAANIYELSEL